MGALVVCGQGTRVSPQVVNHLFLAALRPHCLWYATVLLILLSLGVNFYLFYFVRCVILNCELIFGFLNILGILRGLR